MLATYGGNARPACAGSAMKYPDTPEHRVTLPADMIAWGLRYSAPLPGKEPEKKTKGKGKK